MKRGDTLYAVHGGKLEKVLFLEQGLADPGCTRETWLVRCLKSHGRIRCSVDSYCTTERAAWERYLAQCQENLPRAKKHAAEATEAVFECEAHIAHVEEILRRTP